MQAPKLAVSTCSRTALSISPRIAHRASSNMASAAAPKYDVVVKGDPEAKKLGDCEWPQDYQPCKMCELGQNSRLPTTIHASCCIRLLCRPAHASGTLPSSCRPFHPARAHHPGQQGTLFLAISYHGSNSSPLRSLAFFFQQPIHSSSSHLQGIEYDQTYVDFARKPDWLMQVSGGKVPVIRQSEKGLNMPDSDVIGGNLDVVRQPMQFMLTVASHLPLYAALGKMGNGPLMGGANIDAKDASLAPKLYHACVACKAIKVRSSRRVHLKDTQDTLRC
eukprot:1153532-Pelagomonas_calceolata.AAC.12